MNCMEKVNIVAKISCYFEHSVTEIVQRIFKYCDIQYTTVTLDEMLNSLV